MGKFDRSQFSGSKIASVKKAQEEAKKNQKNYFRSDGTATFHKVEDGRNKFRIAPAHNAEDTPYVPIRTAFLEVEHQKWVDGELTDEKVVGNKKIFIATQHCGLNDDGTPMIPKDPIDVYISMAYEKADELHGDDKDERRRFMNPVTGYRAKGKWIPGIRPSSEFVCYAWDEDGNIGRLGLNQAWMKKMEEISLDDAGDDVFGIDAFSDPDDGKPLTIKRWKDDKNKTNYTVGFEPLKKTEEWKEYFERNRVTDTQLQKFADMTPLKELYVGVYTQKHFDMAVDGLRRFDKKNGYDIFETDEFLTELEEIAKLVPEDKKKEEKDAKEGKDIDKTFEEKAESQPNKAEGAVPPIKMKKFLRGYIAENYGEDYELPKLSANELVEWYKLGQEGDELPFPEGSEEQGETQNEEPETNTEDSLEQTDADTDDDVTTDFRKRLKGIK